MSRNLAKKKAGDARRHLERMPNDIDYRMRKLLNTIHARCKPDSRRPDAKWYAAKGLAVTLTIAELKVLWFRDNAAQLKSPTIDRIDSNLGYTFDNCHFIERADNLRRMIATRKPRGKDVKPRVRRWAKKPTPLEQYAADLHAKIDPFRPKRKEVAQTCPVLSSLTANRAHITDESL